jgi:crotonobetainyl-CoA:carnitine CoA-transferase CaiB-like acyl-CoA transferase
VNFFHEEQHPTEGKLLRMPVAGHWSETQPKSTRHAPRLGEQSAEILKEAGYSDADIKDMLTNKIISTPAEAPDAKVEV